MIIDSYYELLKETEIRFQTANKKIEKNYAKIKNLLDINQDKSIYEYISEKDINKIKDELKTEKSEAKLLIILAYMNQIDCCFSKLCNELSEFYKSFCLRFSYI